MNYYKHESIKNYYCVHDESRNSLMYINTNPIKKGLPATLGFERPNKNRTQAWQILSLGSWDKVGFKYLDDNIQDFETKMSFFEDRIC